MNPILADLKKKSSPLKLLSQMNRNLVGSNYGRSSIMIAYFIPIHSINATFVTSCNTTNVRALLTENRGSVVWAYVVHLSLSSIKIAHFIPIRWQTWSPQTILVSDWPISNNLLLWNCLAKWTDITICAQYATLTLSSCPGASIE
jgi:hypothetical protein